MTSHKELFWAKICAFRDYRRPRLNTEKLASLRSVICWLGVIFEFKNFLPIFSGFFSDQIFKYNLYFIF